MGKENNVWMKNRKFYFLQISFPSTIDIKNIFNSKIVIYLNILENFNCCLLLKHKQFSEESPRLDLNIVHVVTETSQQ